MALLCIVTISCWTGGLYWLTQDVESDILSTSTDYFHIFASDIKQLAWTRVMYCMASNSCSVTQFVANVLTCRHTSAVSVF